MLSFHLRRCLPRCPNLSDFPIEFITHCTLKSFNYETLQRVSSPSFRLWCLLSSTRCSQTVGNIIILCVFTFILNIIITLDLPKLFARSFIWAVWSVLAKWGRPWVCVYTSFRYSSDLAVSSAERPYQVFFYLNPSLPSKNWEGGGGHEKYAQTVSCRKAWWRGLQWFPGQWVVPVRLPSPRLGANFYFQLAALSGSLTLCCETVEPRDARLLQLTSYRTQCVSNTISPRMSWNNATKMRIRSSFSTRLPRRSDLRWRLTIVQKVW